MVNCISFPTGLHWTQFVKTLPKAKSKLFLETCAYSDTTTHPNFCSRDTLVWGRCFCCFAAQTPCSLVLQGGLEVGRHEEQHLNLINPPIPSYSLGQCQHLEEVRANTTSWGRWTYWKRSVCLRCSQSVCLYYILQVLWLPTEERKVCPSAVLCIAKEKRRHCNNCKYYYYHTFQNTTTACFIEGRSCLQLTLS